MKPHLQCAEQQVSRSNLTKYCACHAERLAYLVLIAYETSFTVRGATGVTIQPHQILRLPRKMTRLLYRPHIWNVISNARSNRCHDPTSPNTAPATKNDTARFQRKSPKTGETSFPMQGRSEHDPSMIRAWSDHENANRNPPRNRGYFSSNVSRPILHSNLHQILRLPRKVPLELHQILRLPRKVTLELHHVLRLPRKVTLELHQVLRLPRKVTLELHQVLRLPRKVTLELHQILRLPRKVTLERHQVLHLPRKVTLDLHQVLRLSRRKTHILSPHRIWNVIYSARSNTCHHPTSPNTAPATQNDSHAWSSSHMKPHFQCAEQQVSRSNLTKYCACHEKWHCKISKKISKNRWNVISNAEPIRAWSDHENANRNPPRNRGYFSTSPRAFSIVKYNVSRPILHSNLHQVLRLPRKVTLERHQVLHLPRKVTLELHQVLHLPRKVTLELHYSTLLDSTWLYSTWLYSTWLYLTLLYLTLLDSTWFYLTLSWLYSTLLYLTLLYSTWLYLILLDSSWLYSIRLYLTLLYSTWLYLILLDSSWLYLILLDSSCFYSTRLYLTLLYSTWTLLDSTWL